MNDVFPLYADGNVVGVYQDSMLADQDMVLCKQGDTIAGRFGVQYFVRRMSIIREV